MSATVSSPPVPAAARPPAYRSSTTVRVAVAGLAIALVVLGLFAPDLTVETGMETGMGTGMDGMSMTHYMGLLAVQQPWNLLIFMGLPVLLAETLAISEFVILFGGRTPMWVRTLNRVAGLLAGPVMLGITVHLLRYAVVPLTAGAGWRGAADVVAVLAYLAGTIPMVGLTLVELGLLGRDERHALALHATCVGVFLVLAHVAMIFGMLDPTVLGWNAGMATPVDPAGQMPGHPGMPGMPGMQH